MKGRWWNAVIAAIALMSVRGEGAGTTSPPRLTLQVRPQVMLQGGDIRATARVTPDPTNRLLVLAWEGESGAAGSSSRELEGEEAPITHTFNLREQPGGHYTFVAALYDNRGKMVARVVEEIHGAGERRMPR